jgi:hypothetical protein
LWWREPGLLLKYNRENTPAAVKITLYGRLFLKWWGYGALMLLGIELATGLSARQGPGLLVTLAVATVGGLIFSLFISAITWLASFMERFIDRKICFCKDHIWRMTTAGTARLKYEDVWLCRFRTVTLGEQQIDVMDLQTAEGFTTIEMNPSVSRDDIVRVLRQKQIAVG